ncbi:MAG: tRNA uridine-5-carboxymethylaminomethyl(34) synthesis enzyme MnmG, partial [Mycoplasmataceae bacterium]|nr:tRNA uridine-5-carboxymethylaminomethyl(34) synthesis enzyme MnmG [Mycoplasmataceae bacterium]
MLKKKYDVIVIGAGHAGLEAAFAVANIGFDVALITINIISVGAAPCNPSIGGPAKGVVTREIDALGGMQGKAADANMLQMKILNTSKGPGVWALRAQIDKIKYHEWFLDKIKKNKKINLILDEAVDLIIDNNKICGIKLRKYGNITASKVIITSGVYMNSKTHIGLNSKNEGPMSLERSDTLSDNIRKLGFKIIRLKTGTPPRILTSSIDFNKMQIETGTNEKLSFSHYNSKVLPFSKQVPCYLTYTNEKTHKVIRDNLKLSAMYSGNISGVGPRYCPSIEDKIVKFPDKIRHQTFMEPESLSLPTTYLQGLSTSLPENVQEKFIKTINGLENAIFVKYAYAIEYDAIDPTQLFPSLETKKINGLYFAGQVNGSSGYEEAACQGLIAGINATLALKRKKPLILGRNEAYIGVLIDDLVTKGVTDPYRLLTSRAEYRLLLRNDNADDRLSTYGFNVGLLPHDKYKIYLNNKKKILEIINFLKKETLKKEKYKKFGNNLPHSMFELLKRQNVFLKDLLPTNKYRALSKNIINKIEIIVKFDGYIKNQEKNVNRLKNEDKIKLDKIV